MSNSQERSNGKRTSKIVLGTMVCFSLFIPYSFHLFLDSHTGSNFNMYAILWYFRADTIPPIHFSFGDLVTTIIYVIPRFWFAFEVSRYSQDLVSRTRAIAVGIISELVIIAPRLVSYIMDPNSYFGYYYSFIIPLPTLLIAGLLIIFLLPQNKQDISVFHEDSDG